MIGCGDLDPHWLAFLADAFEAPLVYVRGNHDHGGDWDEHDSVVPEPLGSGAVTRLAGIVVGGLEWPAGDRGNRRRPDLAWWQALRLALRRARSGVGRWSEPMVVISHAAPEGAGDVPNELYHKGFGAYRWLPRPVPAAALAPRAHHDRVGDRAAGRGRPDDRRERHGRRPHRAAAARHRVIPVRPRTVRPRVHATLMRR